uniref:C2H2-type domain-containing protein n=1 Tax=Electrophorus electricus TaxID=8005 RepID=A0A4W4DMR3_ELEEL
MTDKCDECSQADLIPPVEMEDECDIEWKEISNAYLDKPLNKNVSSSKVKLCGNVGKKTRGKQKNAKKYKSHEKVIDSRTSFRIHVHVHGGETFHCETCGKDFKRSDLLTDHLKVHKRKRPYSCDQCGMMFAKPAYLKIHLRRHAGERAFACDHCDKRFFDKYDLKVHQRDHTGERPYVCSECGKSFKRIYILNKHKRTHSKEKPFHCDVCGKEVVDTDSTDMELGTTCFPNLITEVKLLDCCLKMYMLLSNYTATRCP